MATDSTSYPISPFKILGCNLSPRFKDLDGQSLWRAQMPGVHAQMPGVQTGAYAALSLRE
ncbi:hypothetical protein [Streptomyces carpinensis]|uniref:Uncharacterized protein n=1 Tax=Streptomyces carpinensis TaxID=66369 RepID=A0ABV1W4Z2_9ACTN|nr:hypothetical protein [Streptomyces carpinensis]